MDIEHVDGVENGLRARRIADLIAVRQLADGDLNADVREILLRAVHRGSKGLGSDDVVEKRFGPHLDQASDELGLGIGVKDGR